MAQERIRLDLGDTSPQYSWRQAVANPINDGEVEVVLGFRPSRVSVAFVRVAPAQTGTGYDYDPANLYAELYVSSITATGFVVQFRNVMLGELVFSYDAI